MKAIQFDEYGEPAEVLAVADRPVPEIGRGDVRVRILAGTPAGVQLAEEIEALMRDDVLVTSRGHTYALDEIGTAVAQAESVGRHGKVLLDPGQQ
jgi:hypothetical protein